MSLQALTARPSLTVHYVYQDGVTVCGRQRARLHAWHEWLGEND